ncbi:MAG: hypothetical protein ACRDI2_26965, partial [Chloroflexota bacterium]
VLAQEAEGCSAPELLPNKSQTGEQEVATELAVGPDINIIINTITHRELTDMNWKAQVIVDVKSDRSHDFSPVPIDTEQGPSPPLGCGRVNSPAQSLVGEMV